MIIPLRCISCNKVLANKWETYKAKEQQLKKDIAEGKAETENEVCSLLLPGGTGKILDELGLTRICCRRHMLSHIDLAKII